MNNPRGIKEIINPQFVIEGAGVLLQRSIAPRASNERDPFLLFDHFAFNNPAEGPIRGFPTHPHRGIETVTYMLDGFVNHRDSIGNEGKLGAGDVQWMTSGGGIMHEELPRRGESGNIYGFQLWVNLPAKLKWSRPRYQEIKASTIPCVEQGGVKVRVVAGEFAGVRGPVTEIAAEPIYLDVTVSAESEFAQAIPDGHTAIMYLFEGRATIEKQAIDSVKMIVFGEGDHIRVGTGDQSARFMLIAGAPLNEPIAPYGPFVMNTMEEIQEALRDLRAGSFVWNESDPRFTA